MMGRSEIETVVCHILRTDGPDRHVDGYDVISDFIFALQQGDEYEWISKYYEKNNIDYE